MTLEPRIPTSLWLGAALRRVSDQGGAGYVIRRGEDQSGMVCLLHRSPLGLTLYVQERDARGTLGWRAVDPKNQGSTPGERSIEEAWASDYSARAAARDPDLWIVEIETRTIDFPLEGPVLS